ncbi:efflux RND transporter periplasmic adaptor subunit [Kiritimatiella glycovorans]|uniref:Multidrug transporter MdtA n=1 Tax=Kiritimatiella glycovorans TaxID=1307763 RepID=A0A0G3EEY9_9BACT|nr:efflux RND transporter periplasmic adaptor subunit [Kiritimatiella glycovorans]AKJ63987.1 Multidrug transporter MdtA [Kiritimatiella glycovorans]
MTDPRTFPGDPQRPLSRRQKTLLAVTGTLILVLAFAAAMGLIRNRKKPERGARPARTPWVEVTRLERGSRAVVVPVMGTVIPRREITLTPRVTGHVRAVHEDWTPGGRVREDEVLVRIDDRDYRHALERKESALVRARGELALERGRREVARRDWETVGLDTNSMDSTDRRLALRQPQFESSRAAVAAAEAELKQAELDLARTEVRAPFNAVIRERMVEVGDLASPQTPLARLVGTDVWWVRVLIPVDQLKWIVFPESGGAASSARIRLRAGGVRDGRVLKRLPDLEPQGRLARAIVEVPDPLALDRSPDGRVPMLLDSFVDVELTGRTASGVIAIPRAALRENDRVWIADPENRLRIRDVEPVWRGDDVVLVRDGLEEGERLITSNLAAPVEGMRIEVEGGGAEEGG